MNKPEATKRKLNDKDPKRKNVRAALKELVWDKYIGKNNGMGKCFVCSNNDISKFHFNARTLFPTAVVVSSQFETCAHLVASAICQWEHKIY
jgi:hypothetical protein